MNSIADTTRYPAEIGAKSEQSRPMDTINPRADDYRKEVIALGIDLKPTHWVTLNLHRDSTPENAVRNLKRWRVEILRRLFGRRFFERPEIELIEFVGCLERQIGHFHFHLVCRVPDEVPPLKFQRIATIRWKDIVPTGSSEIVAVSSDAANVNRLMRYTTKYLDARSSVPFIHSHLLH